jgi:hypothetical protein
LRTGAEDPGDEYETQEGNKGPVRVVTGKRGSALLMILLGSMISETCPPRSCGPGVIPSQVSHPWTAQWRPVRLHSAAVRARELVYRHMLWKF